jgi:type I restriction enzyme S subunit
MTAPKHWEIFPLNVLVDVLDNLRVPVNSSERSKRPGPVPYYGATGQVGTIDKAIFNEELLVLGEDGVQFFDQNKPKAYKISGPAWVNNHAHVLRPKKDRVLQNFLLHFLNQFNYIGYANGTTRLKLTQGAMNSIQCLFHLSLNNTKSLNFSKTTYRA